MTTVDENVRVAEASGYEVIERFTLPESAWWDDYYGPLEQRLAVMRARHDDDAVALSEIESTQEQIDLYRRFADCYGYVFYVLTVDNRSERRARPGDTRRR